MFVADSVVFITNTNTFSGASFVNALLNYNKGATRQELTQLAKEIFER